MASPVSPTAWTFWGVVLAAVIGATGGGANALISAWRQRRADNSADWQAYTDDLMVQVESLRSRVDAQDEKIATLQIARQHDQNLIMAYQGYLGTLERGILAGTVPPLPPRPPLLGGI